MRPVITWAKLLGIPLDTGLSNEAPPKVLWKHLAYGVFVFFFNVSCSFGLLVRASSLTTDSSSAVRSWTTYMTCINMAITSATTHTLLFAVTFVKWRRLWSALVRVQSAFLSKKEEIYNNLKRVSTFSCLVIAVVSPHHLFL